LDICEPVLRVELERLVQEKFGVKLSQIKNFSASVVSSISQLSSKVLQISTHAKQDKIGLVAANADVAQSAKPSILRVHNADPKYQTATSLLTADMLLGEMSWRLLQKVQSARDLFAGRLDQFTNVLIQTFRAFSVAA